MLSYYICQRCYFSQRIASGLRKNHATNFHITRWKCGAWRTKKETISFWRYYGSSYVRVSVRVRVSPGVVNCILRRIELARDTWPYDSSDICSLVRRYGNHRPCRSSSRVEQFTAAPAMRHELCFVSSVNWKHFHGALWLFAVLRLRNTLTYLLT